MRAPIFSSKPAAAQSGYCALGAPAPPTEGAAAIRGGASCGALFKRYDRCRAHWPLDGEQDQAAFAAHRHAGWVISVESAASMPRGADLSGAPLDKVRDVIEYHADPAAGRILDDRGGEQLAERRPALEGNAQGAGSASDSAVASKHIPLQSHIPAPPGERLKIGRGTNDGALPDALMLPLIADSLIAFMM